MSRLQRLSPTDTLRRPVRADWASEETEAAVERFNAAFGRRDIDAVMAAMTDDCVFEDTSPPNGNRHQGQAVVRSAWEAFFASSPDAAFTAEEVVVSGRHAVVRWRYEWVGDDGLPGHVRGADLFVVRDGKVAEKRSYVKG